MLRIDVQALVGDASITLEDGQKVYDKVYDQVRPLLFAGKAVELDFTGVDILASPFLNAAAGHLLEDVRRDELNRLIRIENLAPAGRFTVRRVIENAKQYYSDRRMHQAVDETMDALKEEAEVRSCRSTPWT